MGIFQKVLIPFALLLFPLFAAGAGETVEDPNRFGGRTELIVPEDRDFREYLKNYYDGEGFLVVQEEKLGPHFLAEVPFFLNRTYFFRDDPTLIAVERYIKQSEYGRLDQRYKDICWYRNDRLIRSREFYHKNGLHDYPHIRQRRYKADGSYDETILRDDP